VSVVRDSARNILSFCKSN